MKNQRTLFIIIQMFFLSFAMSGQDQQWYILNNLDAAGNSIEPTFSIPKVSNPNIEVDEGAKNDVFIIFENGKYFNSRSTNILMPYVFGQDESESGYSFSFTEVPLYLYYTNKYEDDDNPPTSLVNESFGNFAISDEFAPMSTDLMSANHDIVAGKDYTLILNITEKRDYRLCFNKFSDLTEAPILIEPSAIFNDDQFIFPNVSNVRIDGQQCIELPLDKGYTYVNFRGTDKVKDNWGKYLQFQLNGETYEERLSAGHDPNGQVIRSICKGGNPGPYGAKYTLQFSNDGTIQASDVELHFTLPIEAVGDPCINSWIYGAESSKNGNEEPFKICKIGHNPKSYKVVFNRELPRKKTKKNIARLDFCINLRSFPEDLSLTDVSTYFGETQYPLMDNVSLIEIERIDVLHPREGWIKRNSPFVSGSCDCCVEVVEYCQKKRYKSLWRRLFGSK